MHIACVCHTIRWQFIRRKKKNVTFQKSEAWLITVLLPKDEYSQSLYKHNGIWPDVRKHHGTKEPFVTAGISVVKVWSVLLDLNILLLIRNNKMKSAVLKEVQEPMEMYRYPTFKKLTRKIHMSIRIVPLWSLNAEGMLTLFLVNTWVLLGVRSEYF